MRLYAKLFVMILIFTGIQNFAPLSVRGGDAWFLLCLLAADVSGDEKLAAQLMDEHCRQEQSINDEVRMKIEIEYHIAVAAADAG
jgi:hypothetical protein